MFAIERTRIIKNYLQKDTKVSVAKLSELLNVTEVTIRRDLEKLEKEGVLKRTHGGAVLLTPEDEFFSEEGTYLESNQSFQEIADTAYHLVENTNSIMLTSGPINAMIAKKLITRKNLTVVTNDLNIASIFTHSKENSLICLGGDLEDYALYGQMTFDNLNNFSFDHAFIEIDGFSSAMDMSVSSMKKATLAQHAIRLAHSVTIVCSSANFGVNSLYRIGNPNMAHKILTDSKLDNQYKKMLFDLNLPVFTSIDLYEG